MSEELFIKAKYIHHDITLLQNIKRELDQNHWVGFDSPAGGEGVFHSKEMQDDLKNFIEFELEKARKLLEEL